MNTDLILKNISKHITLDKKEEEFFISILHFKKLKRKEFLLKAGEVCKTENFVTKGCLRTYTIDENGFEHILMFAIEDWWTGDLYSFPSQKPSNHFIDALEDTELLQISKPNLEKLFEQVPKFERFYRIIFQNALIVQHERINQNLSFTAEQRYLHFIKKYPEVEQRISQKHVATFLGITPVFLSMLRKKLSRKVIS
ncbi:MAG: Crp/Fnr family transcriptional regulator [Ginsengibacter sp.]